jgi:hypothetical protein
MQTHLSRALRAVDATSTEQYLNHRNALRQCMINVINDAGSGRWTLADDAALDLVEHWLRDRLEPRLPRCEPVEGA